MIKSLINKIYKVINKTKNNALVQDKYTPEEAILLKLIKSMYDDNILRFVPEHNTANSLRDGGRIKLNDKDLTVSVIIERNFPNVEDYFNPEYFIYLCVEKHSFNNYSISNNHQIVLSSKDPYYKNFILPLFEKRDIFFKNNKASNAIAILSKLL